MELFYVKKCYGTEPIIESLGHFNDIDDAWVKIRNYLAEIDYQAYYYRTLSSESGMVIDYGSHFNFFYVVNEGHTLEEVRREIM